SAENFLPLEFLAAAVFLDDHVGNFIQALIGGEALLATLTFASPPDGIGFLAFARIDNSVLCESTVGALHRYSLILSIAAIFAEFALSRVSRSAGAARWISPTPSSWSWRRWQSSGSAAVRRMGIKRLPQSALPGSCTGKRTTGSA